uniref:Iron-sulfur flavoprotein n=1 Tax=Candidatus Methanogaster sp. ANME-2c ERB4 TaxID=2759911 RepID=A0A7G9YHP4_9EURY|nr:iron-sulfur flavoprotein [Methanosarcinales archaeon ANME-2c ERB4]
MRTINLLGISGSPRLASTDQVVKDALDYASQKHGAQTEYITLHKRTIGFCTHCDFCVRKREGCIQKDGMEEIYKKLLWADAVLIGTPVYQGNLSGQTKTMLDRFRALVSKDPAALRNKAGAAAAVGGDRIGGQELAIRSILDFYVISEMIPVGGGSFGANLGGTFWSRDKGAEGVSTDADGIRSMRRTIDRLISVSGMVKESRGDVDA